ncbi:TIGR01440 family protein [Alicyclobacillus sp. SO9]|nr:TIGR01440 family protein [Alicyclobacillus sp. SO9]
MELTECLEDLRDAASLQAGDVLIVGASTSELLGKHIGKATSLEVGQQVVQACLDFAENTGCSVAFQCCEHLNRAVVVERSVARQKGWREVNAIPVPGAGGAVAAHAFFALPGACLVDAIEADAGIDVGDTLIGMHLRHVAVPVRGRRTEVGQAHITMARTRGPLIGGARAVYDVEEARRRVFPDLDKHTSGSVGTDSPAPNEPKSGATEPGSTCD